MIRGPKIELYSNEHADKVFLWLNISLHNIQINYPKIYTVDSL